MNTRRCLMVAILVVLALQAPISGAFAAKGLTLAVSPFANKTGSKRFAAVSKGLADMLTTDLAVSQELRLVERERIAAVIAELKLNKSRYIDPKTAQKAGKMLGAELMVVGTVTAWAPKLRLDARIVSVETGEVMVTASAVGSQKQFFAVEAQLAKKLLTGFGVKLSPLQRMKMGRSQTRSWKALRAYSRGLDAHDRGDKKAAESAFRAALSADPSFARAQERLEKLGKRVAALEKRTSVVERAGGLIVSPQTAVEFWSNHKVHLNRGAKAKATADAQAALRLKPKAIDALWALCLSAPAESYPGVDAERVKRVCGLAHNRGAAVARMDSPMFSGTATTPLLARLAAKDVVRAYLRLRAIAMPAQPNPTGQQRAEAVALGLALSAALGDAKTAATFDAAFLDRAGRDAARGFVANHVTQLRKRLPSTRQQRGTAHAWAVRSTVVEQTGRNRWPLLLQLRFAEPNVTDVTVAVGAKVLRLVPRALPPESEIAVWQVAVREVPASQVIRWTDGAGQPHELKRAWPKRVTGSAWRRGEGIGSVGRQKYPMLGMRLSPLKKTDRGGQVLIDPVVGLWSSPLPTDKARVALPVLYAGQPTALATGDLLEFNRPGRNLSHMGIVRPLVYGTGPGAGKLRVVGTGRYYRASQGKKLEYRSSTGSLASDRGLQVMPLFSAPSMHTQALATAGRRAAAFGLWRDYIDALPQSVAAWELSTEPGLYSAIFAVCPLLTARSRTIRAYGELVQWAGALRAARTGRDAWATPLLSVCRKRSNFQSVWDQATRADEDANAVGQRWRYRSEVSAAYVLAHGWPKSGEIRQQIRSAMIAAPASSMEVSILWAAAARAGQSAAPIRPIEPKGRRATVPAPLAHPISAALATKPYFLDRDEVSVMGYDACVKAGACREMTSTHCAIGKGRREPIDFRGDQPTHCLPIENNSLPLTWATHGDAARYCAWRGGRLPRATELLTAALDAKGRPYWHADGGWHGAHGNLKDRVVCSWQAFRRRTSAGCKAGDPGAHLPWDRYGWMAPTGAHPASESPSGVAHLVGNAREWVADSPAKVFGCSYQDAPADPATCLRTQTPMNTPAGHDVGFRCAYDREPKRPKPAKKPKRAQFSWAKVPAGLYQLGLQPTEPEIALADPTSQQAAAVAKQVSGVSAARLLQFARKLKSLGVTGVLPTRAVREMMSRRLWTGHTADQAFGAVIDVISKQDSKAYKSVFGQHVYVAGIQRKARSDSAQNALPNRLGRGAIKQLSDRPRFPKPKKSARWYKNHSFDCADRITGTCRDHTGTGGVYVSSSTRAVPFRQVKLSGFKMLRTEVTQAQFHAVMGRRPAFFDCPSCAVERVTHQEARAFCAKIGARLPTEAQWVAAAGAGTQGRHYGQPDDIAWHLGNSRGSPQPVGRKKANRFGLRDMLGGVWEWTEDIFTDGWDVKNLQKRLRIVPAKRLRNAPPGSTGYCIHAGAQLRFAEQNLNELPWEKGKGRYYFACFATDAAVRSALAKALAKAPLGPDMRRSTRSLPRQHVIVGGAWGTDPRLVHRGSRAPMAEHQRSSFVGFRCVK
ncbi:MAG: SUMF1/EgtB/PvdO family nonheme iron enzyme [Myxococcales bacterium]|nr:SUMF1/EgtB/PvdO family nonheme iron enzyme [Myxococcales bacterium]